MDRTKASDAFNAGSIPVGCIFFEKIMQMCVLGMQSARVQEFHDGSLLWKLLRTYDQNHALVAWFMHSYYSYWIITLAIELSLFVRQECADTVYSVRTWFKYEGRFLYSKVFYIVLNCYYEWTPKSWIVILDLFAFIAVSNR